MTAQTKTENSVLPLGGGQTGELFRSIDWSQNPLGPCEQWPESLKALLRTMFHSRQPMFLWWGPELIQFYNDSYLPSFGVGKHPQAMGQRGQECWPEIWPIIKPQIDLVLNEGKATWDENRLIPFFRNGEIEDIFWTYGYSPVYSDAHTISGVFCVCTETNEQVLAERSLKVSEDLLKHSLVDGEIGFWDWNAKTGHTTLSRSLMLDWAEINQSTFEKPPTTSNTESINRPAR
jgi:hypothetical protein